jgi:hypothetical protein
MQVAIFMEAEELHLGRIVMAVLKLAKAGWQDLRHFITFLHRIACKVVVVFRLSINF